MQRRIATAVTALALLAAMALAGHSLVGKSAADLENPGRDNEPRVFTSPRDRIRMVVPRQWYATDQPSYPGLILWMSRPQPPAQISLTAEAFTRELYCSWPPQCRASQESLTAKFACALRTQLVAHRLRVGPTQPGPKENAAAGMSSSWFEYEDGKRFLRHAVALTADRAYSLVLSSPTTDARAAHARAFEQMLRTLRPLSAVESSAPDAVSGAGSADPAPAAPPSSPVAPPPDLALPLSDTPPPDAPPPDAPPPDARRPTPAARCPAARRPAARRPAARRPAARRPAARCWRPLRVRPRCATPRPRRPVPLTPSLARVAAAL